MKLKLLNGAPLCQDLDFSNGVLLRAAECQAFDATPRRGKLLEEEAALKWRDVGSNQALLRTGWSQPFLPGTDQRGVIDSHSVTLPSIEDSSRLPECDASNIDSTLLIEEEASAVDGYLQHSLNFHDTLLSSQVAQDNADMDDTVTSSSFLTTSFGTTESASSNSSPGGDSRGLILQVPSTMVVTPLGSLPSAQYLRTIYPQTPTPNLLCALMTTPERREVFVRKGGYKMALWDITVGDGTRSSFKVTFWSRPPGDSNNEQMRRDAPLLRTLELLQVGDIVLLRNIALSSFREVVHGQSLNAMIARARTSVDILVKSSGMSVAQISDLPATVVETLTRVRRWARSHVAGAADIVRKRKGDAIRSYKATKRSLMSSAPEEDLPPDTMESS